MEALSQGAIADLIVVLQTVNKTARRDTRWVGAPWPVEVDRMLTAIEPSLANGGRQVRHRAREIPVIAFVVPGQASPDLMMKVVRPDGVEFPAALGLRFDHRVEVAMVLGDDQHLATTHRTMDASRKLGEKMARALIGEGMSRVQPQPIEVIFMD